VSARVGDPEALVRRVFIRFATAKGRDLNANQEATRRGDLWTLDVVVPGSLPTGKYLLDIQAMGDEGRAVQWATREVEIKPATFALKLVSPGAGATYHRNEVFDVVAQVDDPRKKTRRVFVYFVDLKAKRVLNGDQEALRRGNLWTQRIKVPATAIPGPYELQVQVLGEGREELAVEKRPITVTQAPVTLGEIGLAPAQRIKAGDTVQATCRLDDPRNIVRAVAVTCVGPGGKAIASEVPAERGPGGYTANILIEEDEPEGTYSVEFRAVAQAGEVVATSQMTFPVLPARH